MDHSSGSRQHILSEHELSCKYDVTVRIRSHMSLSVLSSIMSLCLHVFTALFSPASLSPHYSWRLMMCERHKFDKRSARSACAHKISHLLLIWFPATSGFEAEFLKQVFVGGGCLVSHVRALRALVARPCRVFMDLTQWCIPAPHRKRQWKK